MPLSEHEQRLLEQIERALYAEDPKFASTVRGSKLRKPSRRRRLQGIALFAVGLVLLVVGVAVAPLRDLVGAVPVVSVVGFLAMLAGTMLAISARGAAAKGGSAQAGEKQSEPDRNRFTGRMEERFRRRFEQE